MALFDVFSPESDVTMDNTSSIVNGGSGTDPPLRAVLDPVAAPTIVSEIHTAVPEPHTPVLDPLAHMYILSFWRHPEGIPMQAQ